MFFGSPPTGKGNELEKQSQIGRNPAAVFAHFQASVRSRSDRLVRALVLGGHLWGGRHEPYRVRAVATPCGHEPTMATARKYAPSTSDGGSRLPVIADYNNGLVAVPR